MNTCRDGRWHGGRKHEEILDTDLHGIDTDLRKDFLPRGTRRNFGHLPRRCVVGTAGRFHRLTKIFLALHLKICYKAENKAV
jgi:hypothetical protein